MLCKSKSKEMNMQMPAFPSFHVISFHVMIFPFNGDYVSDVYCNLGQCYMMLVIY